MQWPAMQSRMAPHGSEDWWHASARYQGRHSGQRGPRDKHSALEADQSSKPGSQRWVALEIGTGAFEACKYGGGHWCCGALIFILK